MSSVVNFNLFPVIADLKEGIETYLPEAGTQAAVVLESTALLHLAVVTLKSLPYIGKASDLRINDLCHFIAGRVSYLEVAFVSLGSLVHNVAMTVLYIALFCLSFGMSRHINYSLQKHWHHTLYSLVGIVAGVAGAIFPTLGALVMVTTFGFIWNQLLVHYKRDTTLFEDPLLLEIKKIYRDNEEQIIGAMCSYVGHMDTYATMILPTVDFFGKELQTVQKLDQLVELGKRTWAKLQASE